MYAAYFAYGKVQAYRAAQHYVDKFEGKLRDENVCRSVYDQKLAAFVIEAPSRLIDCLSSALWFCCLYFLPSLTKTRRPYRVLRCVWPCVAVQEIEEEEGLVKKDEGYAAGANQEPLDESGPQEESYADEPL